MFKLSDVLSLQLFIYFIPNQQLGQACNKLILALLVPTVSLYYVCDTIKMMMMTIKNKKGQKNV